MTRPFAATSQSSVISMSFPSAEEDPLLGNASGLFDKIVSGWQVAGTTVMTSGARLSPLFSGVDPTNTNEFSGRPDRIGSGYVSGSMTNLIENHQPIFDKSAFVVPESGRGY